MRQLVIAAFFMAVSLAPAVLTSSHINAQTVKQNLCGGADLTIVESEAKCSNKDLNGDGEITQSEKDGTYAEKKVNNIITQIISILSIVIGIMAVIFIIIGGFKYITSGGDSGKVASAKSTIIYSVIGLTIVALAQFMVRFVLSKVSSS